MAKGGFRIATAVVAGAVAVGAQQRAQEPTRVANLHADTMRPEILGTHGIVAAGRHYSVSAGVRILQQGGNAVDAGVASVLALGYALATGVGRRASAYARTDPFVA